MDCLRQNWQGPIVAYADELLKLIKDKFERSAAKQKER